jgi:predicted methyltransferase
MVCPIDLITIIMNYHDIAYMPVDRAKADQRLFNALKTGEHLVVMDHYAKSGSGISAAKSLLCIVLKKRLSWTNF